MATSKMKPAAAKPVKLKSTDLQAIFGVSHMSILNWKAPKEGVAHRKTPLPFSKDKRTGAVTYNANAVMKWAERNGVSIAVNPIKYLERLEAKDTSQRGKPGPKPRVETEARKKVEEARDKARIDGKHEARKPSTKEMRREAYQRVGKK